MERQFDKEILSIQKQILEMSELVAISLNEAMQGLTKADLSYFKKVYEREVEINNQHLKIDQNGIEFIARHSPLASQLRMMIAVLRINQELECMGDQVVSICRNADVYLQRNAIKPLIDIPQMASQVLSMMQDSIKHFVNQSLNGLLQVIEKDSVIDALHVQILRELFTYMAGNVHNIEQVMSLIFISKSLERMADHASSIAEHSIFSISGQDVRHFYDKRTPQKKISLLFLCVHNSARSQMAEGLAKKILGEAAQVQSAGTSPTEVNPFACHVMREVGVDISNYQAKSIDSINWQNIDFVVTLTEQEVASDVLLRTTKRLHWNIDDPQETFESFRNVRDNLKNHIENFKSIFLPS